MILLRTMMAGLFWLFTSVWQYFFSRQPYPQADAGKAVVNIHGISFLDPYRKFETGGLFSFFAFRRWLKRQKQLATRYFTGIRDRKAIETALQERLHKTFFTSNAPEKRGKRLFYWGQDLFGNQVLFVKEDGNTRQLLYKCWDCGSVATVSISHDGNFVAYTVTSGDHWSSCLYVLDVTSGRHIDGGLRLRAHGIVSWARNNRGFYYYGALDADRIYFHYVGKSFSSDWKSSPIGTGNMFCMGEESVDGRYIIVTAAKSHWTDQRLFCIDQKEPKGWFTELFPNQLGRFSLVDSEGQTIWLLTNVGAPKGRLVKIDLSQRTADHVPPQVEVIKESKDTLKQVTRVGNSFLACYLSDAASSVKQFDLEGNFVREIELPGLGTALGFSGTKDDQQTFYSFQNFITPASIYRLDLTTGKSELVSAAKTTFNSADFVTERVICRSKDGTEIPLFISYRRGLKLDGNNPTILYSYGGFRISLSPFFNLEQSVWMEMGGIFAVAAIRGGEEYGETWYKSGTVLNKQNCFDDFIAAAEWLIANEYTSSSNLAIDGKSNGGLLVGACITQRPELFAAASPCAGVLDTVNSGILASSWQSDYGNLSEAEQFKAAYAYSPLHNVKPNTAYPATLVLARARDRVVKPVHSYKFIAALQAAQAAKPESAPCLLRIEPEAGHETLSGSRFVAESADKLAFFVKQLKMDIWGERSIFCKSATGGALAANAPK